MFNESTLWGLKLWADYSLIVTRQQSRDCWLCYGQLPNWWACPWSGAKEQVNWFFRGLRLVSRVAAKAVTPRYSMPWPRSTSTAIATPFLSLCKQVKSEWKLLTSSGPALRAIGCREFCEAWDPYLAYIAYPKGFCNGELIAITNDNSMFKRQARDLVNFETSAGAGASSCFRQPQLIDQVGRYYLLPLCFWWFEQIIASDLPECTDPDDVSIAVKAFLSADLPIELIELS